MMALGNHDEQWGLKVDNRCKHPALESECRRVHLGCVRLLDGMDHIDLANSCYNPQDLVDDALQSECALVGELLERKAPGLLGYRTTWNSLL